MVYPAVILAGGKSSRMGEPKALLPFGKTRLVDCVAKCLRPQASPILINADPQAVPLANATAVPDLIAGQPGPLAGLHAAMCHLSTLPDAPSHVLSVPVDCPFLPEDLARRLAEALAPDRAIVLAASDGHVHPVIGLWPLALRDDLASWLRDPPTLKVRAFAQRHGHATVDFPLIDTVDGPLDPFFNINTKGDLDFAQKLRQAVTRLSD